MKGRSPFGSCFARIVRKSRLLGLFPRWKLPPVRKKAAEAKSSGWPKSKALAVCQLSRASRATQVSSMLRQMFVRSRQGALLPVTPRAVVDCTALDRLEIVVAKTSADVAARCAAAAATHTDLGGRRGRDKRENIPELTVVDLDSNGLTRS